MTFILACILVALAPATPSTAALPVYGPGAASYAAYYANPISQTTWGPFCSGAGDGASYSGVQALGVPACGPTPSSEKVSIEIGPSGNGGPTADFQCVEFAERYLWVRYGFAPINMTNGDQVVAHYAPVHKFAIISNGSGQLPQLGAVMSFADNSTFHSADGGHVAVVTNVTSSSVTVVGENQSSGTDTTVTMKVSGNDLISSYDPEFHAIEWFNPHVVAPLKWGSPVRVDPMNGELWGISCPTTTFCMAVDGAGRAFRLSGGTWSAPMTVLKNAGITFGVQCRSALFCVAEFPNSIKPFYFYNGSRWTAPTNLDTSRSRTFEKIWCASAAWCLGVTPDGKGAIYQSGKWGANMIVDPEIANDVNGNAGGFQLACASSTFCAVVDDNSYAVTFNGARWTSPHQIYSNPGYGYQQALSCADANNCVTTDFFGGYETFNGVKWSLPTEFGLQANPTGLSCPTTNFCEAIDQDANAYSFDGADWSPRTSPILHGGWALGVSCSSSTDCWVISSSGYAAKGT